MIRDGLESCCVKETTRVLPFIAVVIIAKTMIFNSASYWKRLQKHRWRKK